MKRLLSLLLVIIFMFGISSDALISQAATTLVRVDTDPTSITFNQNGSTPIKVYAIYSDGQKIEVTQSSSFTTTNRSVAYVSNYRVYNGSNGTASIYATFNGMSSKIIPIIVNVQQTRTLVRVDTDPTSITFYQNGSTPIKAYAIYSNGEKVDVTSSSSFTSGNSSIAYISNGYVYNNVNGTTSIYATYNGMTSKAIPVIVNVQQQTRTLVRVDTDPTSITFNQSGSARIRVYAVYSNGQKEEVTPSSITSNNTSVAYVSNGYVINGGNGTAVLYAYYNGMQSNAIPVIVNIQPTKTLSYLQVSPTSYTFNGYNTYTSFNVSAVYSNDDIIPITSSATYSSSNSNIAYVDKTNGRLYSGNTSGSAVITITYGGKTAYCYPTVNVQPTKTLVRVDTDPTSITFYQSGSTSIKAYAIYSNGDKVDVTTSSSFTSSNTGIAYISNYRVYNASNGSTSIYATFNGMTSKAIPVLVNIQPTKTLVRVDTDPTSITFYQNGSTSIKAYAIYSNGEKVDVTTSSSFTSSNTGIAYISNYRVYNASNGSTSIYATFNGMTSKAIPVLVNIQPTKTLVRVDTDPTSITFYQNGSTSIKAYAIYSNGEKVDVTTSSSFTSSNTGIAYISNYRVYNASNGSTSIYATYNGMTSKAIPVLVNIQPTKTLVRVDIDPTSITFIQNGNTPIKAYAIYSNGDKVDVTTQSTFKSSNTSIAYVNNYNVYNGENGTAKITANYNDMTSSACNVYVNLIQIDKRLIDISVSPSSITLENVDDVSGAITVTAIYDNGDRVTVPTGNYNIVSEDTNYATIVSGDRVRGINVGNTRVQIDYRGITKHIPVEVLEDIPEGGDFKTLTKITITPSDPDDIEGFGEYGDTLKVKATYSDGSTETVTDKCDFESDDDDIVKVYSDGRLKSVEDEGTATITASYTYLSVTKKDSVDVEVVDEDDDDDDDDINDDITGLKIEISNKDDQLKFVEGTDITYYIDYYNGTDEDQEDVEIVLNKPSKMKYKESDENYESKSDTKIKWDLGTLKEDEDGRIEVTLSYDDVSGTDEVTLTADILQDSDEEDSSSLKNLIFEKSASGYHTQYIYGYPDGSFRPENTITRQETAAMLVRIFNLGGNYSAGVPAGGVFNPYYQQQTSYTPSYQSSYYSTSYQPSNYYASSYQPYSTYQTQSSYYGGTSRFRDVTTANCWGYNEIMAATSAGLFNGYGDGSFRPEAPVTRAEFLTIIANRLEVAKEETLRLHYPNIKSFWASNQIEQLYRLRLLLDSDLMTRNLNMALTRQEAVTILNRVNYRGPLNSDRAYFWDISPYYPGFGDIQEAGTTHSYSLDAAGEEEER